MQLIKSEFLYLPRSKGGLQVMFIESHLKKQRMLFLQQFTAWSTTQPSGHWTLPGSEVLKLVLPAFGPTKALDILTISPRRHRKLVQWNICDPWWKETCIWFHDIRWDITIHSLPMEEQFAMVLDVPIWFHNDQKYHYEPQRRLSTTSLHRRCIGMAPEPSRSFRKQFAQLFRIRTLRDMFAGRATWFGSSEEFMRRYYVTYEDESQTRAQIKHLKRLYVETTQILRRSVPSGEMLCATADSRSTIFPILGIRQAKKQILFPYIPRNKLLNAIWIPTTPDKPHPMLLHWPERDRNGAKDIVGDYFRFAKHLRRRILPIYEDVQFRLAFRLLPVRSRFWFLKDVHPDIQLCTQPECGTVESYQHLFFECEWTSHLWNEIIPQWRIFFKEPVKWHHIACARMPMVYDDWKELLPIVRDLWHALVAVTIHYIWTDRNSRIFDKRVSPPILPSIGIIFTTFSAHVRFFRRQCYSSEQNAQLDQILTELRRFGSYKQFFETKSQLLQIRWKA